MGKQETNVQFLLDSACVRVCVWGEDSIEIASCEVDVWSCHYLQILCVTV